MKTTHHTIATIIAGAALGGGGRRECTAATAPLTAAPRRPAAPSDRGRPGAYVKDSEITAKIKAKLASEHVGSVSENTRRHGRERHGVPQRYSEKPGRYR